jgi:REP element-mobilizing transposase RayT
MHRNSQKRFYGEYIYFITCNVEGKNDFFHNEILCNLWIKELSLAKDVYRFLLFAFCLNYDHYHIVIMPNNEIANYSEAMRF